MFDSSKARGFQVAFMSHAEAILSVDFPTASAELEQALLGATIPIEEIIASGGGEAKGTQRLRRALASLGWRKINFVIQKVINNVPRESQSHEIDHVKTFENGSTVALEIEWNNKDPFFDRDLENFKRLHADDAISAGVIVTRGRSLHEGMRALVRRFLDEETLTRSMKWRSGATYRRRASAPLSRSRLRVHGILSCFARRSAASSWPTSLARRRRTGGSWRTASTAASATHVRSSSSACQMASSPSQRGKRHLRRLKLPRRRTARNDVAPGPRSAGDDRRAPILTGPVAGERHLSSHRPS